MYILNLLQKVSHMIKGIGHIGIAVKNLDETLAIVSKSLGVPIPPFKDIPDWNLRIALVDLGGVRLEFIQDNRKDGNFAKFVNQKGMAFTISAF
jgi:hypothetical protein